jgi:glycerophosphoryl diester phosphodiesterase
MVERPLVIAHRGFNARYPENTLAAARAAIQVGADLIEIDVQQTSDGEIVVFHDFELRRLCGMTGRISQVAYSRVRKAKSDLATLRQMLQLVRGTCPLLIEMKRVDPVTVAQIIEQAGMVDDVIVFAFKVPLLKDLAAANPRIRRFGLVGDDLEHSLRQIEDAVQVDGIGIANRLLRSRADVQRLQRRIGEVFVWTVNRESRMRELSEWGVDGIITNHPDRAVRLFK